MRKRSDETRRQPQEADPLASDGVGIAIRTAYLRHMAEDQAFAGFKPRLGAAPPKGSIDSP
jgi:hypothetical protein